MSTANHRAYEEIVADVAAATATSDAGALRVLAEEMLSVGTQEAQAVAHRARGTACILTGADGEALEEYEQALALYEVLGHRADMARVLGNMGNVYTSRGSFPEALDHFRRALEIYEDLGDRAGVGVVTGNMGNVFQLTGSYPSAFEHFRRALEMHKELGNRYGVAIVTGNIGSVYSATGSYTEALDQYRTARKLHEELGDLDGVAIVTCNMGNVYSLTKSYPEALEHFTEALKILEELGNAAGVALVTGNIITALLDRQDVQEASELLERQAAMTLSDPTVHALHFQNKARILQHAGDLVGAQESLQQALQIATSAGIREGEADIRRRLRDLAQLRKDFDGYIEHNTAYQKITEEIRGREATQRMVMMEAEHRMSDERREREKERAVLYSTLPKDIADRIVRGEKVTGDHYDQAAVIFLDIVDFTSIAESLPPNEVVQLLEEVFTALDAVVVKHSVTKIKTIGDSYMAVAFGTTNNEPRSTSNEVRAANAALDMLDAISHLQSDLPTGLLANPLEDLRATLPSGLQVRIGLHAGPVTAGVIGTGRIQYDVWGDTVNIASRMESASEPGRIHVSSSFALALRGEMAKERKGDGLSSPFPVPCSLLERGALEIKGKGTMSTYWLERA